MNDFPESLTLADLSESAILQRIFPLLPNAQTALVGPGDDCAVMSAPDSRYVVTTDMMVQGPDFRVDWSTPLQIGIKAAATNLADVAAMGALPTGMVVSIAAPPTTLVSVLEDIATGLREACLELAPGCGVVGGDLSVSPHLVISVTAFGDLQGRKPILRSGAHPGDVVALAGRVGLAGLGLEALFAGNRDHTHPMLLSAQLAPWPPISQGVAASVAGATAGMDISDSLVMDAGRIARASSVVIDLEESALDDLASHIAVEVGVDAAHARHAMLFGGEDHALLMTFPSADGVPPGFSIIGQVREVSHDQEPGVTLSGTSIPETGWNPYSGWDGELS